MPPFLSCSYDHASFLFVEQTVQRAPVQIFSLMAADELRPVPAAPPAHGQVLAVAGEGFERDWPDPMPAGGKAFRHRAHSAVVEEGAFRGAAVRRHRHEVEAASVSLARSVHAPAVSVPEVLPALFGA